MLKAAMKFKAALVREEQEECAVDVDEFLGKRKVGEKEKVFEKVKRSVSRKSTLSTASTLHGTNEDEKVKPIVRV